MWVTTPPVWDFPPPHPPPRGTRVLVSSRRSWALGPAIWLWSCNSPHSFQLWFAQSRLVLCCCFSSLKWMPLHLAAQPHVHADPTTAPPPLGWEFPSCQPTLSATPGPFSKPRRIGCPHPSLWHPWQFMASMVRLPEAITGPKIVSMPTDRRTCLKGAAPWGSKENVSSLASQTYPGSGAP